jgi:sugar lactone lactonase YvrE
MSGENFRSSHFLKTPIATTVMKRVLALPIAMVLALFLALTIASFPLLAQSVAFEGLVTTTVGTGSPGFAGDGGPAISAKINYPLGVAVDRAGNLYIADPGNGRVRKVSPSGIITTVAGNGSVGYGGDGGQAIDAQLWNPISLAVDTAGNLYISDNASNSVRKVDTSGVITTVAGVPGSYGYAGDGGPATSAQFEEPRGLAVDGAGNLYIADLFNQRIRKVNTSGIISTVAGNGTVGFSGDGGLATNAQLEFPLGVAVDSGGNLYIADYDNSRIRKVDATTKFISTVAGNGAFAFSGDGGLATNAELYGPQDVTVDSAGNLFIADYGNLRVRKIDAATNLITTVAGNGTQGYLGDYGPATSAEFNHIYCIAVDNSGNLYIPDAETNHIREVNTKSINFGSFSLTQFSQTYSIGFSFNAATQLGGTGVLTQGAAGLDFQAVPGGTCAAGSYSAGSSCIMNVTFAAMAPGPRQGAMVVYDASSPANVLATVYLSGTGIGPAAALIPGTIFTVAGNGIEGYNGDNIGATTAELGYPVSVAVDGNQNVYISDMYNGRIRMVSAATGQITTFAGTGVYGYAGYSPENVPASMVELSTPGSLAVDGAGNLYIAEGGPSLILMVNASTHLVSIVAGNGINMYAGDNGPATLASVWEPSGLALDGAGNLYISDSQANRVRMVNASTGIITTVAGNGTAGYNGDGIPATSAELNNPWGVAVDGAGNLYIADYSNNRVRMVSAASGYISTVAGTGNTTYNGDNIPATSANVWAPTGVAVDAASNIYISDEINFRIRMVSGASGLITTVAGGGGCLHPQVPATCYEGDGGPATSASLLVPRDVTLDAHGNIYIADTANEAIRAVNVASSSMLFSPVPVGQTGSPQTLVLTDVGSAPLNISSIPRSEYFQIQSVGNDCAAGTPVPVGGTCAVGVVFAPTISGNPLSGSLSIYDDAPNSPQTVSLTGGAVTTPLISWPTPAAITYGTALSATQLGASTTVLGNFSYNYTIGTVLNAGTYTLQVTFTPTDTTDYTTATGSVTLIVNAATPAITWPTPTAITYGTALSATQLNATANVPGTFVYSPGLGSLLNVGSQTLSAAFTPTDSTDYTTATKTVTLAVLSKGQTALLSFTPQPMSYTTPPKVTLADSTPGAVIYYTTDGSTPTVTPAEQYTAPFTLTASTTIRAIALAPGYTQSSVITGVYTLQASVPGFTPQPMTYSTPQKVSISDTTPGAVIYYTIDGSTPTATPAEQYTAALTVSATTMVRAIAVAPGYTQSPIASGNYTLQVAMPTFAPAPGTYSAPQLVTIADSTTGAAIYYTTDGSYPSASSTPYKGPFTVSATTPIRAIAVLPGYSASWVASATYTLQTPMPGFTPQPMAYSGQQLVSITDTLGTAVIYYTLDGSTPSTTSPTTMQYSGPITISATTMLRAMAIAPGYNQSPVMSGTYTIK